MFLTLTVLVSIIVMINATKANGDCETWLQIKNEREVEQLMNQWFYVSSDVAYNIINLDGFSNWLIGHSSENFKVNFCFNQQCNLYSAQELVQLVGQLSPLYQQYDNVPGGPDYITSNDHFIKARHRVYSTAIFNNTRVHFTSLVTYEFVKINDHWFFSFVDENTKNI